MGSLRIAAGSKRKGGGWESKGARRMSKKPARVRKSGSSARTDDETTRVRQFGHENVAFSIVQLRIGAGLQAVLPRFLWWHV